MKNKKTRINTTTYYTEGRNVFGQKCKTELIIIKKETALTQMLDAICTLKGDENKEYTFDVSCFKDSPAELNEVFHKVESFMRLMAKAQNLSFGSYNGIA